MAILRSVELFTGAGGLAFGITRAGFTHKLLVEIDRNARAHARAEPRTLAPRSATGRAWSWVMCPESTTHHMRARSTFSPQVHPASRSRSAESTKGIAMTGTCFRRSSERRASSAREPYSWRMSVG